LMVATIVVNNPISTARFQVGTIILSLYFVFPWTNRKAAISIYGLLIGLVVIFPYADLFRNASDSDWVSRLSRVRNGNALSIIAVFDSFQQIINATRLVQTKGIEWGHQITSAFLFWIPRSIWPGKAVPTGEYIALQGGYDFTNLSAPLWA